MDLYCELLKRQSKKFSDDELMELYNLAHSSFKYDMIDNLQGEVLRKVQKEIYEREFRLFKWKIRDDPAYKFTLKKYREKAINEIDEGTAFKLFTVGS